jgi:methyl-accepting chemotaxis protein
LTKRVAPGTQSASTRDDRSCASAKRRVVFGTRLDGRVKDWRFPPRRVVVWHVIAALPIATVVMLGAFLSYHYHVLSIESRAKVDLGYETLEAVDALFVSVEDANVAEREFVITGDAAYLAPFDAALGSANRHAATLKRLLSESRRHESLLAVLEEAVAGKLNELGQNIDVRRSQGFEAARADLMKRGAEALMDRVREQAIALARAERELLSQRQQAQRKREQDVLLIGVLIATLSIAIRIVIAWSLARLRKKGTPAPLPGS